MGIVVQRSRYWLVTINNPLNHGFDRKRIKTIIEDGASVRYYCISDEVGKEGTPHVHFYVYFENAVSFKTMQNKFLCFDSDGNKKTCAHID